jgi:hypothetical protein
LDDHISHEDLVAFAQQRINLPSEDAAEGRARVKHLRERLEKYIDENPDFNLVKMLHAGSVAKGTGLRNINDMDVAVYIRKAAAPEADDRLVDWLVERLREAFNGVLEPEQIQPSVRCATVTYKSGTLRQVDVVPVLYEGEPDDQGYLVAQDTGERLLTSVRLHLDFIRRRKSTHPEHYAQLIRFLKWWIRQQRNLDESGFKFKSFMAELVVSHLVDDAALTLTSYPKALQQIFGYLVKSGLEERIAFTDYYGARVLPPSDGAAIEIFDPVNPDNNVAKLYTVADRRRIFEAAETALGAISEARTAPTKELAVASWQKVLGPAFRG